MFATPTGSTLLTNGTHILPLLGWSEAPTRLRGPRVVLHFPGVDVWECPEALPPASRLVRPRGYADPDALTIGKTYAIDLSEHRSRRGGFVWARVRVPVSHGSP